MAKLINGNGNPAVYANQDADLIAAICGNVTCIAAVGSEYAATQQDANTIGLADGVIITQEGRRIQLDDGHTDLFTIPTGTAGTTSYYIVGYKLTTAADSSQTCEKFVQKMNSSSETITEDTFRDGSIDVYVSVYRITQDGLNIDSIELLLPKITNIRGIESNLTASNDMPFKFGYDSDTGKYGFITISGGSEVFNPFGSGVSVASIAVTTMPTKTTYTENENLDLTGIVITATFEDGVTSDVTGLCSFSPADGTPITTLGTIVITVTYHDITTSFNVTCTSWDSNTMANNSWAAIQEHIAAGTLPASFVGQTKPITMDGNTYNLQLARINDGTGTAGTYYPNHTADFISVELMPDTHNMNPTNTNVGGWKQCAMRTYLTDTVYPALPDDLKAVIIDKTHMYTQGNQSTSFESVSDKLWLPTEWECFGSATYGGESASYNVHYSAIFPDATSRQKTRIGQTSANTWWESSPNVSSATAFCSVNGNGAAYTNTASTAFGVVLGLRIG